MKEIRFIDEMRIEFLAAVTYYEQFQRGLGVRFRNAIEAASALAARLPNAGSQWKHGTRRVFTKTLSVFGRLSRGKGHTRYHCGCTFPPKTGVLAQSAN